MTTEDKLAMYFVVRKDARLTLGQGMARAGAAAAMTKRLAKIARFMA